jgi:hypothetical protein
MSFGLIEELSMDQVPFFATEIDDASLREYISSLGLWVIPCYVDQLGQPLGPPEASIFCYISGRRPSTLFTTTHARPKFNSARSPLIEFSRSRREGRYLVAGRVCWVDIPGQAEMRSSFEAIQEWIHEEWTPQGAFWLGPNAEEQWREGALELAPVSPATEYRVLRTKKHGDPEGTQ